MKPNSTWGANGGYVYKIQDKCLFCRLDQRQLFSTTSQDGRDNASVKINKEINKEIKAKQNPSLIYA